MSRQLLPAQISADHGALVLQCEYHAGLVAALKAGIPSSERKFDPVRRAWIVDARHGTLLVQLVTEYLGQFVSLPTTVQTSVPELRTLYIKYVGQCKSRPGYDSNTALGLDDRGDWSVIFPQAVLQEFFTGMAQAQQTAAITLYGVLGITRGANPDEIKGAYRRMARQWHPDVCKEPDASETFLRIKNAYEILSMSNLRARYDAGLALEETLKRDIPPDSWNRVMDNYRAPLRCGYVLAEGIERVGRFNVTRIQAWEDITDSRGRTLVTSWPMGATHPVESWV